MRHKRPRVRGDCASVPRPCPYVGCRYNTFLDLTPGGKIRRNWNSPEEVPAECSCALDVAERGSHVYSYIARCMNCTRQRVQQIEDKALAHARKVPIPVLAMLVVDGDDDSTPIASQDDL